MDAVLDNLHNLLHAAGHCLDCEFHSHYHSACAQALKVLLLTCDKVHGTGQLRANQIGVVHMRQRLVFFRTKMSGLMLQRCCTRCSLSRSQVILHPHVRETGPLTDTTKQRSSLATCEALKLLRNLFMFTQTAKWQHFP